MRYVKAQDVLPDDILKIIQQYVDGEYLYVPRVDDNKKAWGEQSGTRHQLKLRNIEIYSKFQDGMPIGKLAQEYYLSDKSIRRIVREQKRLCS